MTANEYRKAKGFIESQEDFEPCYFEEIKLKRILFNRISELEKSLAIDDEKYRAVFKIHQWENLKARIYYSRSNLELNKQLLSSLK